MLNDRAKVRQKLSAADVADILLAVSTCCPACGRPPLLAPIAASFGVSRSMVSHIASGRSWLDVPLPENDQ